MIITQGKQYRVVKRPELEYLTVGAVYVADYTDGDTIGLHMLRNGAGTFIRFRDVLDGTIVLEEVAA